MRLASIILAAHVRLYDAHGAVVQPPPRQSIDGRLQPWASGVPYPVPFPGGNFSGVTNFCPVAGSNTVGNRGLSGKNGQACFWFSNGCSIGCDECDGVTRGPIPIEGAHGCMGMKPLFPDCPSCEDNCKRKMDVEKAKVGEIRTGTEKYEKIHRSKGP